jgi:dipeptidyl aminopeptidase/acylaminoacyl peptidase
VALSQSDEIAFGQPTISPDGSVIAVTVGKFADAAITPGQLVVMPLRAQGGAAPTGLVQGEVYEPDWSPDGSRLVYIKRDAGKRHIYSIKNDGSDEKAVSTEGEFATPKYSPQQ